MSGGALSHIRVLDLSRVLAGPWCGQILGDLGADVIKVENPDGGDDTRGWGPPFLTNSDGGQGDAAYYLCANRNKRSIAVNLREPEGQAIIQSLARQSDVVIENYKTGGLKRFGLDYESLKADNPGLVYCSITGFGQTGPYANLPGYDFLIQAMGGLMSVTGEDEPVKVGVPIVDLFTGVYAATAILAALEARSRGGPGQHIDMALFDVQAAMLANQAENYLVGGRVPGRMGNRHPNIVPYQDFPTSDGRIAVAVGADRQFRSFAGVLGRPEWADDPRYARNAARVAYREELCGEIASVMRRRTSGEWRAALDAAGIPCGPIQSIDSVFAEPQAGARNLRIDMEMTGSGSVPLVASPLRLGGTPVSYRRPPPRFAEHTGEVLQERLGFEQNEVSDLMARGIVA
ncbi:MAG: CoA transferase [Oceanicaulis sp.]|uniref:CaiB/BaiF CoA transferase family protein n=1 Tax=Glycocaulis sp. TaxID=1969725 RepID=UPI0025B8623A|nr:CaiB/BaiF CoA-transferase family protein [Glycocaulis sp.]MCC5982105.1 CoA transferase [Oceanicaulis sp.]MCH8521190.1 CoA transferase [Glycocaulis sp.]